MTSNESDYEHEGYSEIDGLRHNGEGFLECLKETLVGRRIVAVEEVPSNHYDFTMGEVPVPSNGDLVLDNGTRIRIFPSKAVCPCGGGLCRITKLAKFPNVITDVKISDDNSGGTYGKRVFGITVITEYLDLSEEVAQITGFNDRYMMGYTIMVIGE
jgi:hypothetical protein